MVKKKEEQVAGIMRQFVELKQKHPDAMLLFRQGDFYEMYRKDAIKASVLLALKISERIIPSEKDTVKTVAFPKQDLDVYLPKLIRSGWRVAICDAIETLQRQTEKEQTISNSDDMAKKKKNKAVQEEPIQSTKKEMKEKPVQEVKAEQQSEAKQERKPHEPQMVTTNGEKMTHGHAYQSKANPEDWYFTAKMDGRQLKPQKMDATDLAAYQKKEITVPQLMERYYPTKLMPYVSEEAFKMPKSIAGPEGSIQVEKFNVYKEKDEQRPNYGKYKFYAQVGEAKMSAVASIQDLNAYFDRVATPEQLVERNFGERLHLKSAYEKYQLPEWVDPKGVRVAKDRGDNKWKVSVKGRTNRHEISFDDGYSLFKTKTATREQIAAKYLNSEISGLLAANTVKVEKSASMKL